MRLINSLATYLLLLIIFVAVAGIAAAIGITLRKRKIAKDALAQETAEKTEE